MKKALLSIAVLLVLLLTIVGCEKEKEKVNEDAIKFKEEYESLNGQVRESNGKTNRTISISEENPMIYVTTKELVSKIESGEDFIAYMGFAYCPWCRSVLPSLLKVAEEEKVEKIYYLQVREGDLKEDDIRGYKSLDKDNKVVVDYEPTEGYYDLLKYLDEYLDDYTLETSKGKKIQTGEKRLMAPTVIAVKDKKVVALTSGISELQTDGYMELTDEMTNYTVDEFKKIISEIK